MDIDKKLQKMDIFCMIGTLGLEIYSQQKKTILTAVMKRMNTILLWVQI